jgi:hypothetical protein
MSDEAKLASHDSLTATEGMLATAAMTQAAGKMSGWQQKLMYVFIAITALVTLLGAIANFAMSGSIPACDAQQTRDTLSDLNNANKFNATKYNFIKEVATSETETKCTANLALSGGSTVEYDYRIFKDNGTIKVQITDVRR